MAEAAKQATPAPPAPASVTAEEPGDHIWARRSVLALAGWGAVLTFAHIGLLGFVRFMFPRVLFEPPTSFRAGQPTDYMIGEVSERYLAAERVWIARTPEGFYALSAVCTHLGCTPRWLMGEDKFKCPCHGSGFTREGINFEGPAPRPLERLAIALADDGQLLVDKGQKFRQELGEWDRAEAFLPFRSVA
jgi:cytochrome b6-f complex iron-sulfur subunit